jgi:hypothetical protein
MAPSQDLFGATNRNIHSRSRFTGYGKVSPQMTCVFTLKPMRIAAGMSSEASWQDLPATRRFKAEQRGQVWACSNSQAQAAGKVVQFA